MYTVCALWEPLTQNPKLPRAPLTICMGARGSDRPTERLDRTVKEGKASRKSHAAPLMTPLPLGSEDRPPNPARGVIGCGFGGLGVRAGFHSQGLFRVF